LNLGNQTEGFTIVGSANNDTITGGQGNDNITGGAGADAINAGAGANSVTDAGVGADVITHNTNGATVVVAVTGTDTVTLTATEAGATVNSAAGVNTTVNASTSSAAVTLSGNTGNDTFTAGSGADNLSGGNGNDVFRFLSTNFTDADTVSGGNDADTIQITDNATVVDIDFDDVSSVETLLLSGTGTSSVVIGTEAYAAGIRTVTASSGNDTISTFNVDSERGDLTINLASGGQDTVLIRNDVIGNNGVVGTQFGLGGQVITWTNGVGGYVGATGNSNATTLNATIAAWTAAGQNDGIEHAIINGFAAGNSGDRVAYLEGSTPSFVGGLADNVSLTTNNLSGLAVNSVIEVASNFQINDGRNLGAVATMLDQLNNVQDGNYYVVIYDGTSADSNAWIYAATATEGDGFDFADTNGATNGFDTDTVELIGVLMGVGADNLTSQNFISSI
jgi:hypothetical protein